MNRPFAVVPNVPDVNTRLRQNKKIYELKWANDPGDRIPNK